MSTLDSPATRDASPLVHSRWVLRSAPKPGTVDQLAAESALPSLLARILAARGFGDPSRIGAFLNPRLADATHDPFIMKGVVPAVERIRCAIDAEDPICIFGDYDVDGVTATALLTIVLRALGATVDYYIPHRLDEGYGVSLPAIDLLADQGFRLIVTVDCGITSVEEVERARARGLDVIVTDHHEPGPERPEAVAVIDPKQPDCPYPCKDLAGVGVAFKLAHALLKRLHPDPTTAHALLKSLIDLVALGTVADIVPLLGENRALVNHGLDLLRRPARQGLIQLFDATGLAPARLTTGSIGFVLGPRLNAAGRTEHAMFGVELLLAEDRREARDHARKLNEFNNKRRDIEQRVLAEAVELAQRHTGDRVVVISQQDWHPGVLGIVASRIQSILHRPILVLSESAGLARGSGRSIPGFDLHAALTACAELLDHYGGHKMAAGLALPADRVDAFRDAINRYARATLDEDLLRPLIEIDAVAVPGDLTFEGVAALDRLEPFGMDNPRPVVQLEGYTVVAEPRVLKDRHLKLRLAGPAGEPLTALGWGMAARIEELDALELPLQLAGTPFINHFNGRTHIEFELKDFRPT